MQQELTTARLILNQLQLTDKEQIFTLRTDKKVNQFVNIPPTPNLAAAEMFIQKIIAGYASGYAQYWAIRNTPEGELMGTICLWNFDANAHKAEIGFTLLTPYWGNGYNTEALLKVIQYGFQTLQLRSIDGWTHQDNIAAKRCLEKAGFIRNHALQAQTVLEPSEQHLIIYTLYPDV